jgi:SpoVK/Ycf46/Vps4 family AAA+-type ATPase
MPDVLERLKILIDSSTPIVVMETVEEMRVVRTVRAASAALNLAAFEWSIASGLVRCGVNLAVPDIEDPMPPGGYRSSDQDTQAIYNSREPAQMLSNLQGISVEAVFILKDLHRHMDDAVVVRRLRDVGQQFSANRRTLVLTGPKIDVPPELRGLVEFLELPLPDRTRLRQIIDETLVRVGKTRTLQRKLNAEGMATIAENLRGLTEEEAERALSQALVARYALCPETATDVLEAKKDMLRRSGMLEFVDSTDGLSAVGGLENLKHWLAKRRGAWSDSARTFGLDPARGVIILGVQGCGKSLCARAIAGEWSLPLVKFDSAAIFDKYIGETEKRIRQVFRVAEGLSPCVLWIDELEKVFAGAGPDSASVDAGVSSRILAAFLSWMQDRKAPVFVAATSNNVSALPPELIRKGRFDELFFVDLPGQSEREQILSIQLAARKRDPKTFDLIKIAAAARGYSGAEIDAAVRTALYSAYTDKSDLTNQHVLDALAQTVPLSITRAEEIDQLRTWAKTRAVPAQTVQHS